MAGVNTAPIKAVSVVKNVKQVWCVAVDEIAGSSSLRSFGGTFSKSDKKCHQLPREHFFEDTNASVYRARSDDRG